MTTLDDVDVNVQHTVWEILKLKQNMVLMLMVKMV